VILYRKATPLRVRRAAAPEAPFWAATSIAPYGAKRATPIAIDYLSARASGAEKLEVTVCENVRDELERARMIAGPVLIDAAESAEVVFRRGAEAASWCAEQNIAAMQLISTRSVWTAATPVAALTGRSESGSLRYRSPNVLVIAAWPLDLPQLAERFAEARDFTWGVAVPVIYPITTELAALEQLADLAKEHGAAFLAAMTIDVEPTAKQAIAQSMQLEGDDDRYAMLFHADAAPVQLATERHIAALAHARGMLDFITPPRWEERSNWNAAVLLTLTASRMIAMELDLDLAGTIARSARTIAELDKPLTRIAESASLSIVGGLDETSAEMLTEWIEGAPSPSFAEYVNEQWRLRRG
jgi:hypothetical protein